MLRRRSEFFLFLDGPRAKPEKDVRKPSPYQEYLRVLIQMKMTSTDQFDNLEKHTQWGIDFLERYAKFVKERSEIEINYAKQIRTLSKKYQPKKNSREEEESKYTFCRAFVTTLNELNDYAGQHEVIAENLTSQIIGELSRYLQDLKTERKTHFHDGRKAQQHMEGSWKQLESCKRKFERDCKEADKAKQYFDKMDADINVTKADVEKPSSLKARQQAAARQQMAADSKSDYSSYLQKFNQEQNEHYYTVIPNIFQKVQDMEEKRIERMGACMKAFADVERQVIPIVGKCLDGMTKAAEAIQPKTDSKQVVESYKSGFEPPGDVEFEDYGQAMKRAVSECSLSNSRGEARDRPAGRGKAKLWPFLKSKNKLSLKLGSGPEDYSHLPPEQRKKKLQGKLDELNKDIQKETEQRDALTKMKDVYVKNPQMGDAASVDPRLDELGRNIQRLQSEVRKFEGWLAEAEERLPSKGDTHRRSALYESAGGNGNCAQDRESPDGSYTEEHNSEIHVKADVADAKPPAAGAPDFDDEFDDDESLPTIGNCKALYPFDGHNEGTISVAEGEPLHVIEEDKGDGWTRVRRNHDEEGYVPTSYLELFLGTDAKGAVTYI
ncbi:formin-binding protein 1 homolog isoform X20 [Hippocampus zosterae]|uniref:formin-binding protein 1 homolog isoform X20 n=1 Tax=Hippocampus zosterae TaxID=109293 RepID=UPI00223E7243|nr:formin-binding protein 1 homolog isoform X20 [Hippocampus zosterae]